MSDFAPPVVGLGYIRVESAQIEQWKTFGAEVLGAQPSLEGDAVWLRVDDRPYRIVVEPGERESLRSTGWELRDEATLDRIEAELITADLEVERATPEEAFRRRVGGLIHLQDPSGNRLELFHSPLLTDSRFVSPVGVSEFVTGDMGLGHVVLPATAYDETAAFYTKLLGFRLSDRMRLGADEGGSGGIRLDFFHCNPRHHSLALIEVPQPTGISHFMLEVRDIDEVGYALDRCTRAEVPLGATLGRHTNDKMVSFYMKSPSGFDIEYGYGGLRLDLDDVSTSEITAVSHWGHDFSVGFRE